MFTDSEVVTEMKSQPFKFDGCTSSTVTLSCIEHHELPTFLYQTPLQQLVIAPSLDSEASFNCNWQDKPEHEYEHSYQSLEGSPSILFPDSDRDKLSLVPIASKDYSSSDLFALYSLLRDEETDDSDDTTPDSESTGSTQSTQDKAISDDSPSALKMNHAFDDQRHALTRVLSGGRLLQGLDNNYLLCWHNFENNRGD